MSTHDEAVSCDWQPGDKLAILRADSRRPPREVTRGLDGLWYSGSGAVYLTDRGVDEAIMTGVAEPLIAHGQPCERMP